MTEKNIEKKLWVAVLVILMLIFIKLLTSCTTPEKLTEYRKTEKVTEDLLKPNMADRIIVGYSKNKKFYKVVNQKGITENPVRILKGEKLKKIGDALINKDRVIYGGL